MLLSLIHGTSKSKCNRRNLGPALMSWMSSSGLLTGLSDPNLAEFYTQCLDTKNAANMLKQQGPSALGLAARRDGDGDLVEIHHKAIDWVNENKLWDRKQLMSALELVKQPGRGEFICLLGGKSTGKTLALQTFSESSRNIIKINGRLLEKKQGILMAVIEELTANSGLLQIHKFATNPIVLMETMKASCFALLGMPPETDLTEVVDKFRLSKTQDRQDAHILKKLLGILSGFYGSLTLVMDEANLIFDHKQGTDNVRLAKDYLEVLTALSKESRQISVVLASSEHSFPFTLSDSPLGFTTSNFTKLIFAGEVSPSEMYKLLTEEWGVGPHLAEALLDHYGGHIWDCYHAVMELAFLGSEEFRPGVGFGVGAAANVLDVLAFEEGSDEDRKRMKDVLRQLAERGFAPLYGNPYKDPVARKISEMNVGGVVSKAGTVIGLPRSVWQDEATGKSIKHGLVPHKQSIRLLIAEALA